MHSKPISVTIMFPEQNQNGSEDYSVHCAACMHRYVYGSKRLGCQEVSGCRTIDESEESHCMQTRKHTSQGSTLALKSMADVSTSPKQGYQWPHKKD